MRFQRVLVLGLPLAASLLVLQTPVIQSATPSSFNIAPGPKMMTPEEKALGPDSANGSETAIILIEETDRNEVSGVQRRLTYHFRAKIFSSEGAGLGSVRIPLEQSWGKLQKWWGWTLLPDGSVRVLKKGALQKESTLRASEVGGKVLVAQLEVVPGCVIDYGYVAVGRDIQDVETLNLRRGAPLRELRYRWTPGGEDAGDYCLPQDQDLDVSVVREGRSLLLTARGLPALVKEPWMPPEEVASAAVSFYHHDPAATASNYWRSLAKKVTRVGTYFSQEEAIRQAIASMSLPASADLKTRLKLAYDWVMAHIRNTEMLPVQGIPSPGLAYISEGMRAQEVLGQGVGDCRYVTFLYWGIARALGAQVGFVPAPDRRQDLFDASFLSLSQFSRYLLAVGVPGEPSKALSLVDICTGLPFGEVPWWHTGFESVLLGQDSADRIMLTPEPGGENISETEARILFRNDRAESARWIQTRRRQQGLSERLYLRLSGPVAGKHVIKDLCGNGGKFSITKAEESGADELSSPLRLDCEADLQGAGPDTTISVFRARFIGPWVLPVPAFPSPVRVNPVVFDFSRVDQVGIDVNAPPGFVPSGAPPAVHLETPYGEYTLNVTARPDGYRVERTLFLSPVAVSVSQYGPLRSFLTTVAGADQTLLEFKRSVPGESRE